MFVRLAHPTGPMYLVNTAAITWAQLVSGPKGVEQVNIHFAGGPALCFPATDDLLDVLDDLAIPATDTPTA
jgi:hypothetical protein